MIKRKFIIFVGLNFMFFLLFSQTTSFLIMTNVKNVEVYIDGYFKGLTANDGTFFLPQIKVGKHRIELKKNGYKTIKKEFRITDLGGKITFNLKKKRFVKNVDSSIKTTIFIKTNVNDADVFIDGVRVGKTLKDGSLVLPVKPGIYTIEVSKQNYNSIKGKIYVGEISKRLDFTLTKKKHKNVNNVIYIAFIIFFLIIIFSVFILLRVINKKTQKQFGRFVLKDLIGKGGMALVYSSYDPKFKREIALKLMDTGLLRDTDLVEKFIREGQAIARINEKFPEAPVVKVYEFGKLGSNPVVPYIVMEKLKGVSLLDEFKKIGKFPHKRAYRIIKRIAEALMATHKTGVYHRDVTPDNIIIIKSKGKEDIRLIDFGVAKHEYTSYKTLDGSIAGKPPYMSPEQCKGEKITAKSDIYSLGIIFYMLIEGKPPYSSSNPLEIMKMHENSPVPELSVEIEDSVRTLIRLMLAKKPEERPESVIIISNLELLL